MSDSPLHGVFGPLFSGKVGIATEEKPAPPAQSFQDDDDSAPQQQVGQIALDVYQDGDYLVIKAPIAGVKLSDLDIDVAGNVLTIRGERKQTDEVSDEQYLLQECYWGEFQRSVTLPFAVSPTKVKATFNKDNVLKVFVQREKKVKIVKINEGG